MKHLSPFMFMLSSFLCLATVLQGQTTFQQNANGQAYDYRPLGDPSFGNYPNNSNWSQVQQLSLAGHVIAPSNWNVSSGVAAGAAVVINGSTTTADASYSLSSLTLSNGGWVTINSGITLAVSGPVTNNGVIVVNGSAMFNSVTNFNMGPDGYGGDIAFFGNATASNTIFTNNGATAATPINYSPSSIEFFNNASAGNGTFTNNGSTVSVGYGGYVVFSDTSTAGNGTFINNGPTVSNSHGSGGVSLNHNSTAGTGNFTNNGGTVNGGSGGNVGIYDNATAGTATFTNNGGTVSGAGGGLTSISDFGEGNTTGGNGTFINNGATVSGATGGYTEFGGATAGSATLTANGGSNGGLGGAIYFYSQSDGGTAKVIVNGNGFLTISGLTTNGMNLGSIEGNGTVNLGAKNLSVGGNNLSTTFSGSIQGGGTGGSITKTGSGTLTLTGTSTYAGSTTVNAGTLTHSGVLLTTGTIVASSGGLFTNNSVITLKGSASTAIPSGGTFAQTTTGTLNVQIGGKANGQFGRIVAGNAILAGKLNVTFVNGFQPGSFDTFKILSTTSRSGKFNNGNDFVQVQVGSVWRYFKLNYANDGVTLQPTGLTVTGRVLNGSTKTPLAGATVSLAGLSTTSAANGSFTLANVNLTGGSTLTVTASGFVSQTRMVVVTANQTAVNLGDISLAPSTNKPVVESVKPDVDGIFLAGFGLIPTLKATVNWNGNTPGSVEFRVNGSVFATLGGSGPDYSVSIPVDSALRASLSTTGNVIAVTATAQEAGRVSVPVDLTMAVVPLPAALQGGSKSSEGLNLKVKFSFPATKPFGSFSLPVLGSMGGETSVAGEFSYNLRSGAWEVEFGKKFEGESTKYSAFKLKLGPLQEISAEIKGKASGTATRLKGIDLSGVEIVSTVSLNGKVPLGSFSPFVLIGPGATSAALEYPVVNEAFRSLFVVLYWKPALSGQQTSKVFPTPGFKDITVTGKSPLEAAYEPTFGDKVKVGLYVGGEPSLKFGLPGEFFREFRCKVYSKLKVKIWAFNLEREFVFVDFSYPAGTPSPALNPAAAFGEDSQVLAGAENATATWQAMQRPWRDAGGEVFLPQEGVAATASSAGAAPQAVVASGLDAFVRMGQSSGSGEPSPKGAVSPKMILPIDPAAPVQATFPLLSNVFPDSEPALAGKGNELMLAYVRDTGAANPVQFTEVAYSYFNGTTWTVPAAIASDVRGQFSPQVVFDCTANAVAVYERIKDGAFAGTVLADMAALMEIVWSRWDAVTKTWSVPQAITNNAFLDFNAKLSGPLADGDLLLTWNESTSNQIDGTGIAGAATNLRVMTRRWDSTTQTWGTAAVLVPNLTGELSESLGARGNKGVYVWSVDLDGNTDDSADAELYYRLYNATTDTWSPAVRHTTNAVVDHHAKAVVDAAGNVYAVWNRNGDLVMDVNFAGTPSVVRSGAGTPGVADFALTIGPAGNLALIWQEMTENGSDAHYRVYDPLSSTWGQDAFLSQDSDLERSFAPVWDAAGNLTLAYNNVVITKQTVNVVVEGGGTVSVDGVPQPGQVNLLLAKRTLVKDLSAVPEGLTADGTTFLPGDAVTLKAKVKNAGNLAVENVQVAFYDGDPANGGTVIGTATVPGWLEAMTEAEVSLNWTVPQPAQARTVHIQIDPSSTVSESDETNNALALPLNGVDLALEYLEGSVLRDGSARVVVKVRNLSAPESPVTTLRLKAQEGGATLAETTVSQLAPGQSIDVPFDLPAGTHPEGDGAYLLVIDEEDFASDIDRDNNAAPFALNLWIDDDGDGIPRWWEQANGMSDTSSSNALADVDGDGFDALAEFLAGTDPRNAQSRLGVGQFNVTTNAATGQTTGVVSWASVAGRLYRVERSFNLSTWQIVADDVEPHPPLNTISDTVTPPGGRVFYRVLVK